MIILMTYYLVQYSTQYCLLVMLEKFKESVDKGNEREKMGIKFRRN